MVNRDRKVRVPANTLMDGDEVYLHAPDKSYRVLSTRHVVLVEDGERKGYIVATLLADGAYPWEREDHYFRPLDSVSVWSALEDAWL